MEPKRSGETTSGELQDSALQDPAVWIGSWLRRHGSPWPESKVVIHKSGSLLRGTLLPDQSFKSWEDPEGMRVRLLDPNTGHVSEIPIADAKAVFFVKSFVEQPKHEDLHFYDAQAEASFLWVRITFFDGHVIECLVPNTSEMVLSAGFFAWSIDPEANNLAVYIVKKMIKKFQVLGVRHLTPKNVNGSPTESWGRSDSIHLQQHAYPSD